MDAQHTPLRHLAGAAHVEGLDHSTEAIGRHGDDVLAVCLQQGGELGHGVVTLALFEQQGGDLAAGGEGGRVLPAPLQLCGDEHQPLVQGVPQELQRLWTETGEESETSSIALEVRRPQWHPYGSHHHLLTLKTWLRGVLLPL